MLSFRWTQVHIVLMTVYCQEHYMGNFTAVRSNPGVLKFALAERETGRFKGRGNTPSIWAKFTFKFTFKFSELQLQSTDSMEHSPFWEAYRSSARQKKIIRVWCNTNVHYRIHKRQPPVRILLHINPVHSSPSHCLRTYFNIILPSMPRSLSSVSPHNPVCTTTAPVYHTHNMFRPYHSYWFDSLNNIWWEMKIVKLPIM
jgi:hypothetical protein